jgi:hypothetical protein
VPKQTVLFLIRLDDAVMGTHKRSFERVLRDLKGGARSVMRLMRTGHGHAEG